MYGCTLQQWKVACCGMWRRITGAKVSEEPTTPPSGCPKMVVTNPSGTLIPRYQTARHHAHNKHRRNLAYQRLSVMRSRPHWQCAAHLARLLQKKLKRPHVWKFRRKAYGCCYITVMSETPASRLPPCSTAEHKGATVTLFQHTLICKSVKHRYTV